MRALAAATIFSRTALSCCLAPRGGLVKISRSSRETTVDDDAGRRGGAEHLLGLPLELRLGHPDGHHAGQTFEDVLLGHAVVAGPEQPGLTQ